MKVVHGNISQTTGVTNYIFSFICKNILLLSLHIKKISVSHIDALIHSRNILCFPFSLLTF